jgi:4-hydroxy 2-oxovalerate aldolase
MTKILDCTLRDGGYYTNWDFDKKVSNTYFESLNQLPVDYLEIGYRSQAMSEYLGKYYYCPIYLLEAIRKQSSKKIVVILNEKDVRVVDLPQLILPIIGYVDMVRLAIDPKNFSRALVLAEAIKKLGFEVGFNVMYMSNWDKEKEFLAQIKNVDGIADIFYMVDSYGGVYPSDVKRIYNLVREQSNVPIGFHGHNNLELGLINTLTAIECGAEMVDTTITGMGRGAGNLKTELLLTSLQSKGEISVDFNALSKVVAAFTSLQEYHGWGTNLPYMVSGANSLPQKEVMDWMAKRYYSLNSIIRALTNQSQGKKDNETVDQFPISEKNQFNKVLIVGGGPSIKEHSEALTNFLTSNPTIPIIHASSKNARIFEQLSNPQFFCLMGNEGHRMEEVFGNQVIQNGTCILPPFPREMGTYIPQSLRSTVYELKPSTFFSTINSQTAMALELALSFNCHSIFVAGYDGYTGTAITEKDQDLFIENEHLFQMISSSTISIESITPTRYSNLKNQSIYQYL